MSPADVTLEKTLPNSVDSERAVLGAILLDHKAIFPATEVLTAADFYLEAHREIFRAMLGLAEEETSIDLFHPPGRAAPPQQGRSRRRAGIPCFA